MTEDRTLEYPDGRETEPAGDSGAPMRVGAYRLLQKLGEGGMGEVWEAEQESPVRRRVALKLIKPGMDSKLVLARFETERQALALMNHAAIAKVFDAGTTEQGRPFFVMELVRGVRISRYCDRERLSTQSRLRLFLEVCDAVQHAHQKGILHRDLKPSNILVAEEDKRPRPKVIDFGVAKATQQRLSERTVFTQLGQWIGTPAYMSPEQAEMAGLDVDTRTDVYSLGAILYELLVGASVHDKAALRTLSFDEMRRQIREVSPPRPSTRLGMLGEDGAEVARRRETEASGLAKQLQGDLDWIVMKALEKERSRRYGSAAELAADIVRYLDDEPVLARPPSRLYQARKFVRRHRVTVGLGTLLATTLLAFSVVTALQARRVERERDRANTEAQAARQVTDFLIDAFRLVDPSEARGNTVTVREVLDRGAARIDRELRSQPAIRTQLLETFGNVYVGLGLYHQALPRLEEVVATARASGDRESLASALLDLAGASALANRLPEAEALAREALDLLRTATKVDRLEIAHARHRLGFVLSEAGKYEEARAELEAALRARRAILGEDPAVATTLAALARLQHEQEDNAAARANVERALEIRERTLGSDHPDTVSTLCNLAQALSQVGDPAAVETFDSCLARQEALLGPDHPSTARTLNNLAIALFPTDPEASRALFERSLEARLQILGRDHADVAESLNNLGYLNYASGDVEAAREHYEQALAIWEGALGSEHQRLGEVLSNLAQIHVERGSIEDAAALIERAISIRESSANATTELANSLIVLARVRAAARRWQEAEAAYHRAASILEKREAAGFDVATMQAAVLDGLVDVYEDWGKPELAAASRDRRRQLD